MENEKEGRLIKKIIIGITLFFILTENIYAEQTQVINQKTIESYLKKVQVLSGMSSQIEILDLQYKDNVVIIDFSPNIVKYGGGNYTERMIGTLMMEMTFNQTEAKALTLLVEGKTNLFPEGTDFSYCTREDYNMYYKLSEDYNEDYTVCNQESR